MKRTAFFKFFYGLSAPTYFAEQIGKNARNVLFCRYALYAVSRFFVPRKCDCGIKILTLLRIIIYYCLTYTCFFTIFVKSFYSLNFYNRLIKKINLH